MDKVAREANLRAGLGDRKPMRSSYPYRRLARSQKPDQAACGTAQVDETIRKWTSAYSAGLSDVKARPGW